MPIDPWRSSSPTASPGQRAFEQANGTERRLDAERRIEAALEAGDSFDAQIVLMALHAKLISAEVVEHYGLSAD